MGGGIDVLINLSATPELMYPSKIAMIAHTAAGLPVPTNGLNGFIAPDWVGRVEGEVFRRAVLGGAMGEGEGEGEGC